MIDYNVFREQYWPAMSHLAKQFEVDQIFAEILGVIKGSTSAKRDLRPLSREEYLTMSTRVAPVFTEVEDREIVFTVYESYERKKARFGDQDDIDRVVHILRALEKQEDLKVEVQSLFDEVYVDGKYLTYGVKLQKVSLYAFRVRTVLRLANCTNMNRYRAARPKAT